MLTESFKNENKTLKGIAAFFYHDCWKHGFIFTTRQNAFDQSSICV